MPTTEFAMKLDQGTLIGDRYRIEEQLGQGGYGAVFRATQLNLERPVAIKILLAAARGEESLERFHREAEILQKLEHPNIVRLLDFGVGPGESPYLVFELLQGQNLDQVIRADGPLPPPRVARVGAQILKALMEAHARGFVHRDIKPANIFLCNFQGEPDFVKVLDFGIAKGGGARSLTGQGMVVGTLPYMAPEQLGGPGDVGSATDLFALGLTLAEALTGKAVFGGLLMPELVRAHQGPDPVPLGPLVLDSPLGPVIQRATRKIPEQRHASAGEMLAHLEAVMGYGVPPTYQGVPSTPGSGLELADTGPAAIVGGADSPPPGTTRREIPKKRPRRLWLRIGGAVALAAAAAAVTTHIVRVEREHHPAPRRPVPQPQPPPEPTVEWFAFDRDGDLAEAQVNGDGVPDIIGLCGAGNGDTTMSVCAIDGATFKPIWRRPAGAASSRSYSRLGASARGVVFIDASGVAHLLDLATGAERKATRLGARPESICAESSGKLWVVTTNQRAWAVDPAARTVTAGTLPSACSGVGAKRFSMSCVVGRNRCGAEFEAPAVSDVHLREFLIDGSLGIGVGSRSTDATVPMLVGFTPGRSASTLRWRRPVAPGDGLTAAGTPSEVDLRGGRAVVLYQDVSRVQHLAAIDATNGRSLWDVQSPRINAFVLSTTRLYLSRSGRLDVREAHSGRLLGGIGKGD